MKIQAFIWKTKNKDIFDYDSTKVTGFDFTANSAGTIAKASKGFFHAIESKVLLCTNKAELGAHEGLVHIDVHNGTSHAEVECYRLLPSEKPLWLLIRNDKAKTQVNIGKIGIGDKIKLGDCVLKVLEIQNSSHEKDNLLPTAYVLLKSKNRRDSS